MTTVVYELKKLRCTQKKRFNLSHGNKQNCTFLFTEGQGYLKLIINHKKLPNRPWPVVIFHYFSVMNCDLQLQYNLEIASKISRVLDNGAKSREIFVHHSYCNNSY